MGDVLVVKLAIVVQAMRDVSSKRRVLFSSLSAR